MASAKLGEYLPGVVDNGVGPVVAQLHAALSKISVLRGVSIVESFLYFGGLGLAGNIANA